MRAHICVLFFPRVRAKTCMHMRPIGVRGSSLLLLMCSTCATHVYRGCVVCVHVLCVFAHEHYAIRVFPCGHVCTLFWKSLLVYIYVRIRMCICMTWIFVMYGVMYALHESVRVCDLTKNTSVCATSMLTCIIAALSVLSGLTPLAMDYVYFARIYHERVGSISQIHSEVLFVWPKVYQNCFLKAFTLQIQPQADLQTPVWGVQEETLSLCMLNRHIHAQ